MSETKVRVGELRPSQMLFTYGVGAIVDLPSISVIVMGLDDWDITNARAIPENRLLAAIRKYLGPQVQRLVFPPVMEDRLNAGPIDDDLLVGVPVAPFPRWMVCPACRRLSQLSQGMFELKPDYVRPDRNRYVHTHCSRGSVPPVFPARFLVACKAGHLDDFPWVFFVHNGAHECPGPLRLEETGPSGEARDIMIICERCRAQQSMIYAFGDEGLARLPKCRGRRVHLKDDEPGGCEEQVRTILIGASNIWFPATVAALSIPVSGDRLDQLVNELWIDFLQHAETFEVLDGMLKTPPYRKLSTYSTAEVWDVLRKRREGIDEETPRDLRGPEWEVLTNPATAPSSDDFKLREVDVPDGLQKWIHRVVLAERLREVQALTGFTRIESPGDLLEEAKKVQLVPLSRKKPEWLPATEVRGEGILIQLREKAIEDWLSATPELMKRTAEFASSHHKWRQLRGIEPAQAGFPGIRYVLLHSFAHALMRQFSLDCGYSAASIRERIYCAEEVEEGVAMAGVLLYTAAPDSEGTLGGLVSLGEPEQLGNCIRAALQNSELCASDPLCSEHNPSQDGGRTLHGAACHACLFLPETSCERGNRYLDRAMLCETIALANISFFSRKD